MIDMDSTLNKYLKRKLNRKKIFAGSQSFLSTFLFSQNVPQSLWRLSGEAKLPIPSSHSPDVVLVHLARRGRHQGAGYEPGAASSW